MIERTITKSLRFSLAEYESINAELEKTNLSFSSFTRNLLLKKKINSKTDDKLILEINRIGNNLNQIARAVNKQERINVLSELVKIEQSIKELVNGS
ncbi:MobC family plasmid mobilization relaxosome protein [Aliarcobacter cryaerophilus]|uniref:MobC family plasmid mobilization relaxosome protein n=1 Tax=Aliarcobacter cryaerophilus TaxID=28198 RepID=UPI0021B53C56|nr:MobC family plasmid mobilization relaxosome protein [Aliarcobacter cryaerophilus]MCT7531773.1 MobC family plasmid mobilization relaxosome protein [Aliarcobacter cryaerophilus]